MSADSQLIQQAGQSATWQILGGGWHTMVRFGASLFLARALAPDDFGLIGMAMIAFLFIQNLGAAGMGSGIIAKKAVTDEDLSTCFWCMVVMRLCMFLVAITGAPAIASFFNDARLIDVIRVISFSYLISIFSVVSNTLLTKGLRFKTLNIIRSCGALTETSLAVILVLTTTLGYWALVIAMLANSLVTHISIFFCVKWHPKFCFDRTSFAYLFRYGINGLGASMTSYFKQNLDYLLVGRILGTQALGLYEFAYRIPHLVHMKISKPVGAVVFPTLSLVQDDDNRLARGYSQTLRYVCLITFPILFGLAAVADIAVPVLWGNQWTSIVTALRILCFCAALRILLQPLGSLFQCKNRPDLPFKISLLSLFWTAAVVGLLGHMFGLNGVASGMFLSIIPEFIFVFVAFRMIHSSVRILVEALMPVLISATICAVTAFSVSVILQKIGVNHFFVLPASVASGAIAYILLLLLVFKNFSNDMLNYVEMVFGKKIFRKRRCHK